MRGQPERRLRPRAVFFLPIRGYEGRRGCQHVIDEMKLYRYKVDRVTGEVLPLLAAGNDHGMDALRYALDGAIKRGGDGAVTMQVAGL